MTTIRIPKVPREVVLRAIAYKVTVADGMVMFTSRMGPIVSRMIFERKCGCWHVSSDRDVMVSHVVAAQALIDQWFGGNHNMPRGENNP